MGILKTSKYGATIGPSNEMKTEPQLNDTDEPVVAAENDGDIENQVASATRVVERPLTHKRDENEENLEEKEKKKTAGFCFEDPSPPKIKRPRVQFAEPSEPDEGAEANARNSTGNTSAGEKLDGRRWRKMQGIKRGVERRRDKFNSRPLGKRIAVMSKALFACIPYYVDDITRQEDSSAIGSLKKIMCLQLGFSILLVGLAIVGTSRSNRAAYLSDPLIYTLAFATIVAVYLLARKWTTVPPSKFTRGLVFSSHLALAVNYTLAFFMAWLCPERDPFGYASACDGDGNYSMEDSILYGLTAVCWLLLSCPVYICISSVRAAVLGKHGRLTKMEKARDAAKDATRKRMRGLSV